MENKIKVGILNTHCVSNFVPYLDDLKNLGYDYEILESKEYNEKNINDMVAYCKEKGIQQVLACGMTQMALHGAVNKKLASHAASVDVINLYKNKYIQRQTENNPNMWYRPANLFDADEEIISKPVEYPCMMKATAFYLGYYVYKIDNEEELKAKLKELRTIDEFVNFDKQMKEIHESFPKEYKPEVYPSIVFEKRLDLSKVRQFSCDCFTTDTYCDVFTVREEQYFKNQLKMGYMFPPNNMNKKLLLNIQAFIQDLGKKMVDRGLKYHFFNMELFYTEDEEVVLTEVNILFNINYVHCLSLLDKVNKFKIIFDLQMGIPVSKDDNPFYKMLEGKVDRMCLQSVIQLIREGKVSDYIDFDAAQKLENKEDTRVLVFIEKDEYVTQSQIPVPGYDILDVWFTASTKKELYEKDKKYRKMLMKNIDIETAFEYPEIKN